jgi:hypothetical protein
LGGTSSFGHTFGLGWFDEIISNDRKIIYDVALDWIGSVALVKFTGIVDLLAVIGLIVHSLFRYKSRLSFMTAVGDIVVMT